MRLLVLLSSAIILLTVCESSFAQSKNETVEWINTDGEKNLREITGNTSIYWELDRGGTLKITNHEAKNLENRKVVKRFTYLNLYELEILKFSADGYAKESKNENLILRCQIRKNNCIKTRNYFEDFSSTIYSSPSYKFTLKENFDFEKEKKLVNALVNAIKIFRGNASK